MKTRSLAFIIGAAIGALACSSDSTHRGQDPDPGSKPGTLTAFVVDLVVHQTADNTPPVPFEAFASLPDPDRDANSADGYASLFDP